MNRKQRRAAAMLGHVPGNPVKATTAVVRPDATNDLRMGLEHHQAGRLVEAEAWYRRALAVQPNHADTLYLLGEAALQQVAAA
jgi:hypothetical protein